jgi:pimeloyl-ACP methyl ester carboxylesterase
MPERVASEGCEIAYYVDDYIDGWVPEDEKETIVLCHGSSSAAAALKPMAAFLARRYRVVRIDERGFGESHVAEDTYHPSMELLCADILAVLDDLGLDDVHLFGESTGGIIVLHFAISHPDRVKSVTLLQTPYEMSPELEVKYRLDQTSIGAAIMKYGMREWQRRVPGYRVFNTEKVDPRIVDWYADFRSSWPDKVNARRTDWAFGLRDYADHLPRVVVPTLYLSAGGSYQAAGNTLEVFTQHIRDFEVRSLGLDLGQCISAAAPDAVALEFMRWLMERFAPSTRVGT